MKLATILLFNHAERYMGNLSGKVALVTGASRGVGRGIALGLGEAGATVYVTGRTSRAGASPGGLGDTLQTVADEVTHAGGRVEALTQSLAILAYLKNLFCFIDYSYKD